ncbi:MAG: ATP-grasp fold amidoligase family protein [Bacilli bacterium]|nr:ATP-grasp fold amidoligase family protein [Bacilli bacterium]
MGKLKHFLIRTGFRILPNKWFVKTMFKMRHGYKLNFDNPKTFNEIINVNKFNKEYLNYSIYTDKANVKQIVNSIVGEDICFPTIGVYKKMTRAIFDSLPNEFVMKSTHNSQCLSVVKDKSSLTEKDIKKIIKKQNKALKINGAAQMHELQYKNVVPQIIVEKLMLDESGELPKDYKILCIHGEPQFIEVDYDRLTDFRLVFMSTSWEKMPWRLSKFCSTKDDQPEKPKNLDKMLELARLLSKPFPFVRVDLYSFGGKIYFGELTFLHDSGFSKFSEYKWDLYYGNLINGKDADN